MDKILTSSTYRKSLSSVTATIKPDVSSSTLTALVRSGVTIFRVNLSWFRQQDEAAWREVIQNIVHLQADLGLEIGVMLDTQGPEFRIQQNGSELTLRAEEECVLVLNPRTTDTLKGSKQAIEVVGPPNVHFVELGELVAFDDGKYQARISPARSSRTRFSLQPLSDMKLRPGAKVNFPGTRISAGAVGPREREAIQFFVLDLPRELDRELSYVFAQSFVKSANDVNQFRGLLHTFGLTDPVIVAKMETLECTEPSDLSEIVEEASAVMIARGDLANETSRGELPSLQRRILGAGHRVGKPVLLATQVYSSMAVPGVSQCTRPEAEDVRAALEQGVDGFVLTSETAGRDDPETVTAALAAQLVQDERELINNGHFVRLATARQQEFQRDMKGRIGSRRLSDPERANLGTIDFAIAAVFRANSYRAVGIFSLTETGKAVEAMSCFYPECPIFPITSKRTTAQKLLLYRCTHPILLEHSEGGPIREFDVDQLTAMVKELVRRLSIGAGRQHRYAIATMAHSASSLVETDTLLRIEV